MTRPTSNTIATVGFAALAAVVTCFPPSAFSESETQIKESDGKYEEHYKNDDGTKSEFQVDKKNGSSVYKDNNGVTVKESTKDGTYKQQYKDGDCEQHTRKDLVTGDTKVVAKGDCN